MRNPTKIEISHRTIVFTILLLVFVWVLYLIRVIILQFFVALLLMMLLNPFVARLEKFKIPRGVSTLLAYLVVLMLIVIAIAGIAEPLIDQTTIFVSLIPHLLSSLGLSEVLGERIISEFALEISRLPAQIARFLISAFSNVVNVVMVLFISFYLILHRKKLDDQFGNFFGESAKKEFDRIFTLLEGRLGGWLRGQLALMFLVGASSYVGLVILGIPFALPLAILAGLMEIIPYVGPIASAVPAIIIGLGLSPILGLATAALYFLIQQVENYVYVPKIMERSAGVNPVVTLLALAVGFKLAGIVGVIISVPVVITLQVLLKEYLLKRKNSS